MFGVTARSQTENLFYLVSFRLCQAVIVSAILLSISACSDSGSGGGVESTSGTTQPPGPIAGPQGSPDLQGSWSSNCLDPRESGLGESSTLVFNGNVFSRTARVTQQGNCEGVYIEAEFTGTYEKRNEIRSGVIAIDIETSSATVKPVTELGAAILSLGKTCNVSNWKVQVPQNVTAQLGSENCFERYPKKMFNAYAIEADTLYFGRGIELTSPERRPVELERNYFYTRK